MENIELSQLEELLSADVCGNNLESNKKSLSEVDLFKNETNTVSKVQCVIVPIDSAVHEGETDSSDDEERRNCMNPKYNDYGAQIKKTLDNEETERHNRVVEFETRLRETNNCAKSQIQNKFITKPNTPDTIQKSNHDTVNSLIIKEKRHLDVFTDPVFGIRITKPLISNASLLERMEGKETINMFRVKRHVEHSDLSLDWVIAGVIIRKSASKKSQKGSQFLIWTLSDLKDDIKTVSVFLFRKAYNELWKTPEGTVVAVLNPNVLDKSENSKDQACLSVDNADRVMILGQSKDFGTCRSKKKNGDPCTSVINNSQGDHCIYHVKQEYQKFARRQELQSSTMGKGLINLQNKVLGKSTLIYGGKSYSAIPVKTNNKLAKQDQNRLMSLSDFYKSENNTFLTNKAPMGAGSIVPSSSILHSPSVQRKTDYERLNSLSSSKIQIQEEQNDTIRRQNNQLSKGHSTERLLAEKVLNSPKLSAGFGLKGGGIIDLSICYGQRATERAKANAVRFITQNGGIPKSDPNNIKGTTAGKKRALENLNNSGSDENNCKKVKVDEISRPKAIMSERFRKILEATSAHQNLIKQHEDEEQEKYFSKLEKKEAMEEKMLNTFKIACKAVRCVKCKYTAFSASQLCKDESHPLKVLDTYKRFFKCGQCGNRTVSLEIIPLHSCNNCTSSKWEKAPMIREKKTTLSAALSIRGEEETFIGGVVGGKNINLLVPDS